MSWKNFVSAGLMCVLASPVFAAPTLSVVKGGTQATSYLNANGDWVWNIQISNSNPVPTGSSPLAAELGFSTSTALKSATNLSTGAGVDFDTVNPGKKIFTWELPGTGTNNNPEGIQTNCAAGCTVNGSLNQVFSALGSIDYATVGPHNYIQIITKGPTAGAGGVLASTITTSGAYSGKGRIAEALTATTSANFDTYNNVFTRTALPGDANLNGSVSDDDLNLVLSNFGGSGKRWYEGNFNNQTDSLTDDSDLNIVLSNFGATGAVGNGAGLSSGGAVPEPASIALISLALLGGMGLVGRKR